MKKYLLFLNICALLFIGLQGCKSSVIDEDEQALKQAIEGINRSNKYDDLVLFGVFKGYEFFESKKVSLAISEDEKNTYHFRFNVFPWKELKQTFTQSKTLTVTISSSFPNGENIYNRQFQFLPVNPDSIQYKIKLDMNKFPNSKYGEYAAFKIQGHLQTGQEVFQMVVIAPHNNII